MTGYSCEQFSQKDPFYIPFTGSELWLDSDLKDSDKECVYLTVDILHMIYCVVKAIYKEFKEKETFYSEKGRQFPDEFVSFFLFLI